MLIRLLKTAEWLYHGVVELTLQVSSLATFSPLTVVAPHLMAENALVIGASVTTG